MNNKGILAMCFMAGNLLAFGQAYDITLTGTESGTKTYAVYNSVTLGPGYSYSPSGGTLTVNPMVSGSVDYVATPVDPETRSLNTSLMVGATNGSFNVNPMGGASYSIPLELPPGVNGLTPGLSLVYSSNAGPGIAGYGWKISGFSMISRGGKSYYHDNKATGIAMDTTDRFYLDGTRLVNTNTFYNNYSQVKYQTANETFARITPKDVTNYLTAPVWFFAESKTGLMYEFGNTTESRQKIPTYPYTANWYVSKIYDLYGNAINFTYIQDNYNVYPAEITYGPNTVRFIYKERDDKHYHYLKGTKIEQRFILDRIVIKYNNNIVKAYDFKYNNKGSSYNTYSLLNEIIESGMGSARLNSTAFTYQLPEDVAFSQAVYNSTHTYITHDSKLLAGDFNGDGKADVFCIPTEGGWRYYKGNGDNTFSFVKSGDFDIDETAISELVAMDINGDNMDDIMFNTFTTERKYYYMLSEGTDFGNDKYYENSQGKPISIQYKSCSGDINGDGLNDYIIVEPSGQIKVCSFEYENGYLASMNVNYTLNFGTSIGTNVNVFLADFDGDGLADIWKISSSGIKIYKVSGSSMAEVYSSSIPTIEHHFKIGDYNGDGKADMFICGYSSTDWSDWQVRISNGAGFETIVIPQKKADLKDDIIRVGDFNGDGCSDLMVIANADNSWIGHYYYISTSRGEDFASHFFNGLISANNYYVDDFNGDGRDDYLCTDGISPWWDGYRIYNAPGNTNILMANVGNGLGSLTKLTYTKLSQASTSVYQRGTGASFPVTGYQGPLSVVTSIQYDNGRGSMNTENYYYEGLKLHQQGQGFLCYTKTRITDVINAIETEKQVSYHANYFFAQLVSITKKHTGQPNLFETTTNTWSVKVLDEARKRIFPFVQSSTQSSSLTGHSVTITSDYDNYGNPTVVTKSYSNGVSETITNVYNNTVSTTAWLLGRPTSTTLVNTNANGSITRTTTRVFSTTNNNLTRINELAGTDKQVSKVFSYNSNGTVATETLTAGSTSRATQYTYDNNGIRVTSVTDPLAHKNYNSYDEYGRLTEQKDFLNNTITFGYDNFHRQTSTLMSTGNGAVTTYSWQNPQSSPTYARYSIETTSGDGSYAKVWYDKLGREIQSGVKGFNGTMVYTNTEYNLKGQLYRVSDPRLSTTLVWNVMTYDAYGRRTGMTTPSGRNSTWQYNTNTVTETTGGKTYSKTYASDGTLTSAIDAGGTLSYSYYPDGMLKTIITPGGVVTSLEYDIAGNKTRLTDPSAGNLVYTYNAFGELLSQINARNQTTYYVYATDGRLTQKVAPEGNTYYYYNTNKQLSGITSADGVARSYEYDPNGRVTAISETIPGSSEFSTTFTYDQVGRLATKTHPSGITETNNYNSYGYLASVSAGGATRWTTTAVNERGQVTGGRYGSNLTTTFSYDPYGYPTSTVTGSLQSYQYSFSDVTGNLSWRKNVKSNIQENFAYDGLDRLDSIYRESTGLLGMAYNNKGSIVNKTDVGTLQYNRSDKPYVITGIDPATGIIPPVSQTINYTSFESVNSIAEDDHIATLIYNGDDQRARMVVTEAGNPILTRWYFGGSYIKETTQSATKEYTFIGGDAYTAPAVAITENGTHTYYYLLRDHLGSITHVVNASNNSVAAEYSYDAWGRLRNTSTWVNHAPGSEPALMIAGRGYTGHEHLPWFNLINMNGRVYDPLTGQMLSPDKYIQSPGYTQSFNRYGYALNNPLKYADPSGNYAFLKWIVGGVIGGISNVIQHHSDIVDGNPWEVFRDWNIYYNIGNVAGSTGAVVESLIGNKGGIISDAIASGLNGFFEGLINETCNSVYEGNSFGEALSSGYHEGFYRMGGKIATSLVSQDYTIPLGKIFGVNAYTSFNLTASRRNIQNHMVRSLAYHIGGNIFTGKAPFKGFNKDFVGINASMIIPALVDGYTYYANRSGLSDRLLAKQTSSIHDSYAKYMEDIETDEIKYEIKGPINARFFFDSDGYFKVSGFIHVLDNYSDFLGPQNITFVALWVSKINFSFLNSFIIK